MAKNKTDFRNILSVASVYIGLVIGAGFASGQELITYFVNYGKRGIIGLLIAGVIFAVVGWAVMNISVRDNIKDYDEFLYKVFGPKVSIFIDTASAFFILVLFCGMLAGAGALATQVSNTSFTLVSGLTGFLCFLTVLFDVEGIIKVNLLLAPVLLIGGIFFGLYNFIVDYNPVFFNAQNSILNTWGFVIAAVSYASYNIITPISVLSNMKEAITSKKVAFYAGIIGGLSLTILGICLSLPLFLEGNLYSAFEIPMLALAHKRGHIMELLYGGLLFCAIFTTAVSTCFSGVKWFAVKLNINETIIKFAFVFVGFLLSHIGFSQIVTKAYPIFAFVGFFEILVIIRFLCKKDSKKKYKYGKQKMS